MKSITRTMASFVPVLLVVALETSGMAQTVGVTSALRNDVRMKTQASPIMHRVALKERVSMGNDIATGAVSRAQLLLLDQTNFSIGANAKVRIDRFVYDPARNASSLAASVAKGTFRFMSGKPLHNEPGKSAIQTPVASIGIRGTIVEGAVGADAIAIANAEPNISKPFTADPEKATLIILRGPGKGIPGIIPGAIDVTIGDLTIPLEDVGMALFISGPGQAPVGPFLISDEALHRLHFLLRGMPMPDNEQIYFSDVPTNNQIEAGGQAGAGP